MANLRPIEHVIFGITARVKRQGLNSVAEVTITDGVDEWTFDSVSSFTIDELRRRFPRFTREEDQL